MGVRTTIDEYDVEGNYGQGYEVVTSEATLYLARQQVKTYQENEPGISFKIVHRRKKIVDCTPEELQAFAAEVVASDHMQRASRHSAAARRAAIAASKGET
jgi:hypothetical protein